MIKLTHYFDQLWRLLTSIIILHSKDYYSFEIKIEPYMNTGNYITLSEVSFIPFGDKKLLAHEIAGFEVIIKRDNNVQVHHYKDGRCNISHLSNMDFNKEYNLRISFERFNDSEYTYTIGITPSKYYDLCEIVGSVESKSKFGYIYNR